jgi:DNA polymerase V
VQAGFPSPADDYIEGRISLDDHLIANKDSTFFVRAQGNSMVGAGIFDGDLLVVDKSIAPTCGKIVIAIIDNEITIKRLVLRDNKTVLKAENSRYKDI